ncbi:hypothetical protein J3A64_003167 [Pseudarthrobacter sp. PvP004]|nr:hypothetical protein [Pseudarthrobacter sp. PvP004]
MMTPSPYRTPFFALLSSAFVLAALGGCSIGAPATTEASSTAPTSSTTSQSAAQGAASPTEAASPKEAASSKEAAGAGGDSPGGRLDAATEDLTWANGNRILGDENGGHTPDIASSLTDPTAGWVGDYSRMAADGMMTFSSENTRCKVRTVQVRNQPSELAPGDDRASTLKVLTILFPNKTELIASAKDATLGYSAAGNRDVDMLAVSYTSGDAFGYTVVRTFNKPAVTLKVEALCPTLETLKATLPEMRKNITINAL